MSDARGPVGRDEALLTWLALEREAVWFYPVAGARVDGLTDRARSALASHTRVRDRLLDVVDDDTTRAQASYDVGPVDTAAQARAVAQGVERRIQAACLTLLRAGDEDDQRLALAGLRRAALAELTWGGDPRGFPGLD